MLRANFYRVGFSRKKELVLSCSHLVNTNKSVHIKYVVSSGYLEYDI